MTLVNVYLPANGLNAGKIGHLSTLLRPHIKRRLKGRIFMCGDFNFITDIPASPVFFLPGPFCLA